MGEFLGRYGDKLVEALLQHIEITLITLMFSLAIAALLTVAAMYVKPLGSVMIHLFSVIYSIPSLALFAILIPLTGLGLTTAIVVLTAYNQYLLLRNFITGLNEVDPAIVEAATGIGMTRMQVLTKIRIPLSRRAIFTGIQLAVVSTVGIATIAALINAGGLGDVLFDGLRTMNVYKIVSGSVLSAGLALLVNGAFSMLEKHLDIQSC
jgi:ABC-type proline/glycine betaine transport systems, permease component